MTRVPLVKITEPAMARLRQQSLGFSSPLGFVAMDGGCLDVDVLEVRIKGYEKEVINPKEYRIYK